MNLTTEESDLISGWHRLSPVRYDPRHNNWCPIKPLLQQHADHCVCVAGGLIYAIGGRDYSSELESVERYDPHTNTWEYVAALRKEVCERSTAAIL